MLNYLGSVLVWNKHRIRETTRYSPILSNMLICRFQFLYCSDRRNKPVSFIPPIVFLSHFACKMGILRAPSNSWKTWVFVCTLCKYFVDTLKQIVNLSLNLNSSVNHSDNLLCSNCNKVTNMSFADFATFISQELCQELRKALETT